MTQHPFPCWLNKQQLIEANALVALGFEFRGDANDFDEIEDPSFKVRKYRDWFFYSAVGEIALIAICSGAVYLSSPESDKGDSSGWFEEQLKTAVAAIKKASPPQEFNCQQLSIFDFI